MQSKFAANVEVHRGSIKRRHCLFSDNCRKCRPIFVILSLLNSVTNYGGSWNLIYHLLSKSVTGLVKFKCLTKCVTKVVQLLQRKDY